MSSNNTEVVERLPPLHMGEQGVQQSGTTDNSRRSVAGVFRPPNTVNGCENAVKTLLSAADKALPACFRAGFLLLWESNMLVVSQQP
jgi:hypothetical protein